MYYFVAMDENGVYSRCVTRSFDFRREYNYSVDSAITSINSMLVSNGTMENSFGQYEDGSAMYLAYEKLQKIDKTFYYIISATKESSSHVTLFKDYFAFNTETGNITGAKQSGDGFAISEIVSHQNNNISENPDNADNSDESNQ